MCAFAKLNTDVIYFGANLPAGDYRQSKRNLKNDFLFMFMMTRRIISGQANIPAQDVSKANL